MTGQNFEISRNKIINFFIFFPQIFVNLFESTFGTEFSKQWKKKRTKKQKKSLYAFEKIEKYLFRERNKSGTSL